MACPLVREKYSRPPWKSENKTCSFIFFLAIKGKERIKGIKIGNYSKIDEWKKDVFHLKIFPIKEQNFARKREERGRERDPL